MGSLEGNSSMEKDRGLMPQRLITDVELKSLKAPESFYIDFSPVV